MNILKLAMAAAIAFGSVGLASAPAAAQGRHSGEMRHDGGRHDAGRDDNRRHDAGRNDNRRHRGWRDNRGRHRGWSTRRVCRSVWRNHHRQRVCRTVRYRR